jgi:hypothetical protein
LYRGSHGKFQVLRFSTDKNTGSLLQKPLLVTGSFCLSVTGKPPVTGMLSLVINY